MAPSGRELALPQAETEGARRTVRNCSAPMMMRTGNRYGILPQSASPTAPAVPAPSGVPEGAMDALKFESLC